MNEGSISARIRSKSLQARIGSAEDAARLVKYKTRLGIPSAIQTAYPAAFTSALKKAVASRRSFALDLFTIGPSSPVEDIMTAPGVQGRKYGQISNPHLRKRVNAHEVPLIEMRVSLPAYQLRPWYGRMDIAVIEATAVNEEGIIPSTSVVEGATFLSLADSVIVEINTAVPQELEGIHDIYSILPPPRRTAIPLSAVTDRIGTTYIPIDPHKIAMIIPSSAPGAGAEEPGSDADSLFIADYLVDFLRSEVQRGNLPPELYPLEFGIGAIPTAFCSRLLKSGFGGLSVFSGTIGDGILDLIDAGKIKGASSGALNFSARGFGRFFADIDRYKRYIVIRPSEIANCPELISRLGVIAVNGAIEVDIYGHVNSTHIQGSESMGGVGGSCDFAWNGYLSIFALKSARDQGRISTIVPMVTHVDHPEHAVDVVATEQGIADLRGLAPVERARTLIARCAHPAYRPLLTAYLEESLREGAGHEPHSLERAFSFHRRYAAHGSMLE